MRVMIWVDAEGISGITSWEQVLAGRSRYEGVAALPVSTNHSGSQGMSNSSYWFDAEA